MSVESDSAVEDREQLTERWWTTAVLDASGETVFDDEVRYVNSLMARVAQMPGWALNARNAMPRYGFEMCSHRWLEGLDEALGMLADARVHPTTAGRCGDVPDGVRWAASARTICVQDWIEGALPETRLGLDVAECLCAHRPETMEAAECFVDLVHLSFSAQPAERELLKERVAYWRESAGDNPALESIFTAGEGLDFLLGAGCGFKIIDRLDTVIRVIGGDHERIGELAGACNGQLRFVFRDDPRRYDDTRAHLWGMYAWLVGENAHWLRRHKPECAPVAMHTLATLERAGEHTPLYRWLVASMLKATKIWCEATLNATAPAEIPEQARDLPNLTA